MLWPARAPSTAGVVLRLTKEAMLTRRGFWQALESHRMARFNKLAATVSRIDRSVRAAERMFRQVLNRHSNSVKVGPLGSVSMSLLLVAFPACPGCAQPCYFFARACSWLLQILQLYVKFLQGVKNDPW